LPCSTLIWASKDPLFAARAILCAAPLTHVLSRTARNTRPKSGVSRTRRKRRVLEWRCLKKETAQMLTRAMQMPLPRSRAFSSTHTPLPAVDGAPCPPAVATVERSTWSLVATRQEEAMTLLRGAASLCLAARKRKRERPSLAEAVKQHHQKRQV